MKKGSRARIAKEHEFKEAKGTTGTDKRKKFPRVEAAFENKFCNLRIFLAFFMLWNRIQN